MNLLAGKLVAGKFEGAESQFFLPLIFLSIFLPLIFLPAFPSVQFSFDIPVFNFPVLFHFPASLPPNFQFSIP
jgi:hypothetical protein